MDAFAVNNHGLLLLMLLISTKTSYDFVLLNVPRRVLLSPLLSSGLVLPLVLAALWHHCCHACPTCSGKADLTNVKNSTIMYLAAVLTRFRSSILWETDYVHAACAA